MTSSRRALAGGWRLLVVVACAVVLTACGGDPVQEQWESRDDLPSCGSISLSHAEALEVVGEEQVACLADALASGRGAELTVTVPTTEGDAITEYRRVLPDGSTEIYVDSTQDTFSDQRWGHGSCEQPESALDVAC